MNEQLQNELEEQARLLGMSAERECDLLGELERERALADRLAKSIMNWKLEQWRGTPEKATEQVVSALAAWKEARSE